jgi:hypothetical protein
MAICSAAQITVPENFLNSFLFISWIQCGLCEPSSMPAEAGAGDLEPARNGCGLYLEPAR